MNMSLDDLVGSLKKGGVLKSLAIEEALTKVDRRRFVPDSQADSAYADIPLSIGEGQTISQPYTVVFMLEHLKPKRGERIMDVGFGSGWQTGLLAKIVGASGKIYAIEIVPALYELGKRNIAQFPELKGRVEFYCQSAADGLPKIAREIGGFDAIISAAEVSKVPEAWRKQLKESGRLLYPKSGSLFLEIKGGDGKFRLREFPGFAFVPFM